MNRQWGVDRYELPTSFLGEVDYKIQERFFKFFTVWSSCRFMEQGTCIWGTILYDGTIFSYLFALAKIFTWTDVIPPDYSGFWIQSWYLRRCGTTSDLVKMVCIWYGHCRSVCMSICGVQNEKSEKNSLPNGGEFHGAESHATRKKSPTPGDSIRDLFIPKRWRSRFTF